MRANPWKSYRNGDYVVHINTKDGTKIRKATVRNPHAVFAENCDVTITTKCNENCPFCYLDCSPSGKHADLLKYDFLYKLHPFTEMALNGNDLDHPELIPFLRLLRKQHVIPNITVNQNQFMRNFDFLHALYDTGLIYGLGISAIHPDKIFCQNVKTFPTAVVHTIAGVVNPEELKVMSDYQLKLLILGYKATGRGKQYFNVFLKNNVGWLKRHIAWLFDHFPVVSFDNKALKQINIRDYFANDTWKHFYMGHDGTFTFYLDLVNGQYGINSTTENLYEIGHQSIDDMFCDIAYHHGNRS